MCFIEVSLAVFCYRTGTKFYVHWTLIVLSIIDEDRRKKSLRHIRLDGVKNIKIGFEEIWHESAYQIQLSQFWTLCIILPIIKTGLSETGKCLRLKVETTQVIQTDSTTLYLRILSIVSSDWS
jgi:hypothetical protein